MLTDTDGRELGSSMPSSRRGRETFAGDLHERRTNRAVIEYPQGESNSRYQDENLAC